MKNTKLYELKALCMTKAAEIKALKIETKDYQRKHHGSCGDRQWKIQALKDSYRSHHIAYSLLRGRDYKEIEPNSYTTPNWSLINQLEEQYEAVCVDAA